MNQRNRRNPDGKQGAITGAAKILISVKLYNWFKSKFGDKGGCLGCGCSAVLFIVLVLFIISTPSPVPTGPASASDIKAALEEHLPAEQ